MGSIRIISASAGSGKTYALAFEYIRNVIRDPYLYRHILAVTFTNKATEEMKERILGSINEIAQGRESDMTTKLSTETGLSTEEVRRRAVDVRSRILHDYGRFSILTIDKFFQRIIRSFIKELGIDLNFNLELPVESLLNQSADRLMEDVSSDEELRGWIISFINERIEESRQWSIKGDLTSLGKEVFKEEYKRTGSRGPGKKELQKIVGRFNSEAQRVKEALKSQAEYMLKIVADTGLDASDFAYGTAGVYGYLCKLASSEVAPYGKRVVDALERGIWCGARAPRKNLVDSLAPRLTEMLQQLIDDYDAGIKTINTANLIRENYRNYSLLSDLERKIAEISKEENIVHISEINSMLTRLISGNDTPFIFEKAGNHFSHFMIDEFQDTSSMQWENFIPLLRNAVAQSEETPVTLVGDVKQSIYRWRGGEWSILAEKAATAFEGAESLSLQSNYRSKRNVVEFNNALIGKCIEADNNQINETLSKATSEKCISPAAAGSLKDLLLRAYSDYEQIPHETANKGFITVTQYNKTSEGELIPPVIEVIEDLQRRGYAPSDIAILVRRNKEAEDISEILLSHKQSHPDSSYSYNIITQDALIVGKAPVCGFLEACMRLSVDPTKKLWIAVFNRYLGREFDANPSEEESTLFERLRSNSPEEAFEEIVEHYSLGSEDNDVAYLQAFHDQLISFSKGNIADIPLFLEWWHDTGSKESISMPRSSNAITVDTIHRSKGLGYKVVIVPYCNWKMSAKPRSIVWASSEDSVSPDALFPVEYKSAMARSSFSNDFYKEYVLSHIDNMNIFYVAVTRAKSELHLMVPHSTKNDPENIGTLIKTSVTISGASAKLGTIDGQVCESNDKRVISFGAPVINHHSDKLSQKSLTVSFQSHSADDRISIKLGSDRYTEDGAADEKLNPRDYGILMHGVFETAVTVGDIEKAVELLRLGGELNGDEEKRLLGSISLALNDETIRGWYDGSWDEVKNECAIIQPGNVTLRPDRVMIKGKEAVVVDYKFGLTVSSSHRRQVALYNQILQQMGYDNVKGYIWYVNLQRVEQVD